MQDALTGLAARARDGDREAFRLLVEGSWHRLVRLARSVVGDADAEDAAQEGLLCAWQRLGTLLDPDRFQSWAARIVFRRCLKRLRQGRGHHALDEAPEPVAAGNPEVQIDVWQVLSRLAPRQRAVLHLTAVEGMTDSEIATVLGITAGSVRAHRRRARESVQRILQGGVS